MLLNIRSKYQSLLILNAKIVDATQKLLMLRKKSYQRKHQENACIVTKSVTYGSRIR